MFGIFFLIALLIKNTTLYKYWNHEHGENYMYIIYYYKIYPFNPNQNGVCKPSTSIEHWFCWYIFFI